MCESESLIGTKKKDTFEQKFNKLYTQSQNRMYNEALKPIYKRREMFAEKFTKANFNPRLAISRESFTKE